MDPVFQRGFVSFYFNDLEKSRELGMKRLSVFSLFCVWCLFSLHVHAARFSGEYFIKVCSLDWDGEEVVKGGKIACQSYISGVIDYQNTLRSMGMVSDMDFCIAEDVALNDIHLRVLSYMQERTKLHRKFVAAPGVTMALMAAYPCDQ